jgi:hypothetical protein
MTNKDFGDKLLKAVMADRLLRGDEKAFQQAEERGGVAYVVDCFKVAEEIRRTFFESVMKAPNSPQMIEEIIKLDEALRG